MHIIPNLVERDGITMLLRTQVGKMHSSCSFSCYQHQALWSRTDEDGDMF